MLGERVAGIWDQKQWRGLWSQVRVAEQGTQVISVLTCFLEIQES